MARMIEVWTENEGGSFFVSLLPQAPEQAGKEQV
jgi:hypothetical protein